MSPAVTKTPAGKKLTPEAQRKVEEAKRKYAEEHGGNGGDPEEDLKTGRVPLLTIDTLAPQRPTVVFDGEAHEYRLMQEFGAVEHQTWMRNVRRYDELWGLAKPKPAETRDMEKLLDWLFDRCLVDAKALREACGDRLTGYLKREIVLTFSNAPWLLDARAQEEKEETETDETEDPSTSES